jgi:hypothetical protein
MDMYTNPREYNNMLSKETVMRRRILADSGELSGAELDAKAAELAEEKIRTDMKKAEHYLETAKLNLA